MKITMTATELIENDLWGKYCELTGTSEWAANEGQIGEERELTLPDELIEKVLERYKKG